MWLSGQYTKCRHACARRRLFITQSGGDTMKTQHTLKTLSALILGLGAMGIAHGAGFQLLEQNASGLGNAYAGSAAVGENASANFYNPASITLLPGMNVSAGAVAIKPSFKFSDGG